MPAEAGRTASGRWLATASRLLATQSPQQLRQLGRGLAAAAWCLRSRASVQTRINLALACPQRDWGQLAPLARASLASSFSVACEVLAMVRWDEVALEALAPGQRQRLQACLQGRRRGTLVAIPHLGNWEYLGFLFGPLNALGLFDPPRHPELATLLRRARTRHGLRLEPLNRAGLRAALATLEAGGVVLLAPDQVPDRGSGVHAPFFGRMALTATLTQRLVARCDARVLLAAALHDANGFDLRLEWLELAVNADPAVFAGGLNDAVARLVMTAPEQYAWEYRRYKRPPGGWPSPYPRSARRVQRRQNAGANSTSSVKISSRPSSMARISNHLS